MKIISVNTIPTEKNTVYVAVEEFPEREFRISLKESNTMDKCLNELKRRVDEYRASQSWGDQVLLNRIKELIGKEV